MSSAGLIGSGLIVPQVAHAQVAPNSIISVCSGVSLPPSVVTGIMDPVLTGIVTPVQSTVNGTLTGVSGLPLIGLLPGPLNINLTGLLATAASGSPITLQAVSNNGTILGPSSECNATADGYMLDNPAGIAIGGNRITGLGATGNEATAGEIDSIAFGNRATTNATAADSIAIGADASVGAAATGSVALGSGASATVANSVALGAGSVANRAALTGYTAFGLSAPQNSVGSVSVGAAGGLRQITNVAPGTAATDAATLGQLLGLAALVPTNPVVYDSSTFATISLTGVGGTLVTNVSAGALNALSDDAVNGSQLFATNQQVLANTNAITAINVTLGGLVSPIQYSNPGTPTVANGGTPTNDTTLVGAAAGPVGLHNVAAGSVAVGSTDAVNGGQLATTNVAVAAAQTTGNQALALGQNSVQYANPAQTAVTLGGAGGTTVSNLAAGAVSAVSSDAVNGAQLFATNQQVLANTNAITSISVAAGGAVSPVQYSNPGTPTVANGGIPTNDVTFVGGASGPVTLHNVAGGSVAAGSTQAVNGGQLFLVEQATIEAQATADQALVLNQNAVTYDSAGRTSVTLGNSGSPVTVRNIAAGTATTDAVNVGQLNGALSAANAYTDGRLSQLSFDVRGVSRAARSGTAASLAAAALPQAITAGGGMISAGVGTYRGRSAFAMGASKVLPNGKAIMKVGVTYDASEHVGANAGVGFAF